MSEFVSKELTVDAVKYNGKNAFEACRVGSFIENNGKLYDQNGNAVPEGSYAVSFPEGYSKIMTASLFEHIFEEKEPEMYTLSCVPDIEHAKFRRAKWNSECYVYWCGIALAIHTDGTMPDMQYCPTVEDISASDWILV